MIIMIIIIIIIIIIILSDEKGSFSALLTLICTIERQESMKVNYQKNSLRRDTDQKYIHCVIETEASIILIHAYHHSNPISCLCHI